MPRDGEYIFSGARYMLAPSLLLATVIIAVLCQRDARVPRKAWLALQSVCLVVAALVVGFNLRMSTSASDYLRWSDQVTETVEFCETTDAETAHVRIPPETMPWVVVVECDDVAG